MNNYGDYVPNVHFELIPIKNLVSNQTYQRNLSLKHVKKTASNFDIFQINPVKVSRRDGINYVFNGQHTIEIIALMSGSRDTPVWCMIYDDLDYEHEADIFANQMKFVKPLQAYEIFVANVEAGNDLQIIIKKLVESYGLTIGNYKGDGVVCAITTLEKIYNKYGYEMLSRIIKLILTTWEGDGASFSANMFNALVKILTVYKNEIDDDVFKDRLGEVSIKSLTRMAKERRPGSIGFAEAIIIEYNGKKKNDSNKLSLSKLYKSDGNATEQVQEGE